MKKLNLQLFAYVDMHNDTDIVNYLNEQGQDSSYGARKKLAEEIGIKNYTGLTTQNESLLKALQTRQTQNSGYSPSSEGKGAQGDADTYLSKIKGMSGKSGINQSTWDAINKPFTASSAYTDAMKYTNGLLEQLSSGRTSYTDQIDSLINEIMNRDSFEYDADSDMLFQQALASAMSSGRTAMQDTIGQASALTGGYGSTYATAAGNQAYNAYIQDAYANLPEYYQLAMEAYQMEGQEMYDQLAMLNNADATEYQRLYDAWGANFSNAQNMYQQEYGAWQDSIANALSMANLQMQEQSMLFDQTYSAYSASQKQQTGKKENEVKLKEPSANQYAEILRILNEEGEDSMYRYVDSLGADIDEEAIYDHISKYGRGSVSGRTFSIISPGESARYAGKVNYGIFRDQYGNDYTLDEIEAIDPSAADKLRNLKKGQKVTIN